MLASISNSPLVRWWQWRWWQWRWRAAAALGPAVLLGGCVIESGGPTATELYRLIDAHCESATACGCAWATADDACTPKLEARWKARLSEALRRELRYDAECFASLTARIEARGCGWPVASDDSEPPLCESHCAPFHGERAAGESCEGDDALVSDCAQGLVCTDGTCASPCTLLGGRGLGQTCSSEIVGPYDDCAQGLFCSWTTGSCERQPAEGDPCVDGYCGTDLYCAWEINRCVGAAAAGEPCVDLPCADDLYCDWQSNRCVPLAGEGEGCGDRECADGFYCDWDSGVCRPYVGEGQDCSQRPCLDGLWCGDSGFCTVPPGEGQPCLFGSLCAEGVSCDFELNRCVALPTEGQPCLYGSCAEGTWCSASTMDPTGICSPRLANDERCSGHRQCESGYCPNGFCWPAPSEGESCEGTNFCGTGLVCNGTTCEPTLTRTPAACSYPGW